MVHNPALRIINPSEKPHPTLKGIATCVFGNKKKVKRMHGEKPHPTLKGIATPRCKTGGASGPSGEKPHPTLKGIANTLRDPLTNLRRPVGEKPHPTLKGIATALQSGCGPSQGRQVKNPIPP